MSERVSHDNPSVRTVDATLTRSGRTDRPKVVVPGDAREDFPTDEVVRLVLDGTEYRARIEAALSGDAVEFRGAYDTPRLARTPGEGTNHLVEWRRNADLDFDRTVHVDVVEAGFRYGLRAPGETAVYRSGGRPKDSLAAIAEQVQDDDADE
ncbi:hypothetical protein ACFQH6_08335 [Halobacteriaceae archaeon GCM10025711]